MSAATKAVFLSYASQDAEAAKRICDALRAAGVEVWFDQSELVGGDAWDAKIRKQIKECALLVPIISQNTQARTEGYFRLEWRLADQRTHLMAKGRAFLLPVVIDDTKDVDAAVPDAFTEVQWTRLSRDEAPAAFARRVKQLLDGEAAPASGRPSAVPAKAGDKSVAVLAFANLSDDKANEYFSDGISEELLNVLAKIPNLKVSARTSAFYFKGKEVPIPEIARQLGVAYVLEGSVRKQGDKVRITAQLIKAADGFHVWSDTFTRDLKDIFAVQDEIAALIAQNLQLKLNESARTGRLVNPEAHRLVAEGRHFWNLRSSDGFDRAEASFRQAIALDPDYASARAGLANVLATRLGHRAYEGEINQSYESVRTEAARAVALDPGEAEGYPALALGLTHEGKLAEADEVYRKAMGLNPNYALLHHWRSLGLELQGRIDEALGEITRAVELDPLSGSAVNTQARMLQEAGHYEEALAVFNRAAAFLAERPVLSACRAICLLKLNRPGEAVAWARKALLAATRELRVTADADAVHVLREAGGEAEAAELAEQALRSLDPQSYQRGAVLAVLGRWEEAQPYLERMPFVMQYVLYWSPIWDAWRADPRFTRLLDQLGRTQYYQTARAAAARLAAGENNGK